MKYLKLYEAFDTIQDYLHQVDMGDYQELTQELYDFICMEGWLVSLEEEYDTEFNIEDFEYIKLKLTDEDKKGLIEMDDETMNKFNDFDLKLKEDQEFPYPFLDFIDYDEGIVYIIRFIE